VRFRRPWLASVIAILILTGFAVAGCGARSGMDEQQLVVDKAINSAIAGDDLQFLSLVAPAFREEASLQMPEATEGELAAVMAAGFLEDIPFASIKSANYETEADADKAVVHLWGIFVDAGGEGISIELPDALRIPLVREGGRWYLDLLDI